MKMPGWDDSQGTIVTFRTDAGKEYVVSMDYVQRCWEERGSPEVITAEDVQELMGYVLSRVQQEESAADN